MQLLRLRSAIRRHHPPQRAVLSQICCFGERKVVLFQCTPPIKFPTECILPNFHILKINRMMSFCNLFIERPSYFNKILRLANLVQWHTSCRTLQSASANLLSVTRCNISFGARGFRSASSAIWNSLPSNVRSCETLTTSTNT